MIWMDYNIESIGNGTWRVEREAFEKGLYKEGDVFIVRDGWLVKVDDLTKLIYQYENKDEL